MNFVLRVLLLSASRSELQVRPNVVASEILHCHVFSLMKIRKFVSVFVHYSKQGTDAQLEFEPF